MNRTEAIDIVARIALRGFTEDEWYLQWEDYPDLCERDFDAVVARAQEITGNPQNFDAAYKFLADLCAQGDDQP